MGSVLCFLDWLWLCRRPEESSGRLMLWTEHWMGGRLTTDGGSLLACLRRGRNDSLSIKKKKKEDRG
jgi:hypothetical protein